LRFGSSVIVRFSAVLVAVALRVALGLVVALRVALAVVVGLRVAVGLVVGLVVVLLVAVVVGVGPIHVIVAVPVGSVSRRSLSFVSNHASTFVVPGWAERSAKVKAPEVSAPPSGWSAGFVSMCFSSLAAGRWCSPWAGGVPEPPQLLVGSCWSWLPGAFGGCQSRVVFATSPNWRSSFGPTAWTSRLLRQIGRDCPSITRAVSTRHVPVFELDVSGLTWTDVATWS
jgi:hypothetical protein